MLYLSWTQKSRANNHNGPSGCFAVGSSHVGMVLPCFVSEVVVFPLPRTAVSRRSGLYFAMLVSILLLMQSSFVIFYLLAHLLFLVLSCESFLSVWSSRQWKGNCLDQLSSICIFQRHHLSFKSLHSSSRTENNLWSDSFTLSTIREMFRAINTSCCFGSFREVNVSWAASLLRRSPVVFPRCWQQMTHCYRCVLLTWVWVWQWYSQAKRVGAVQPGEEKAPGWP